MYNINIYKVNLIIYIYILSSGMGRSACIKLQVLFISKAVNTHIIFVIFNKCVL